MSLLLLLLTTPSISLQQTQPFIIIIIKILKYQMLLFSSDLHSLCSITAISSRRGGCMSSCINSFNSVKAHRLDGFYWFSLTKTQILSLMLALVRKTCQKVSSVLKSCAFINFYEETTLIYRAISYCRIYVLANECQLDVGYLKVTLINQKQWTYK